MRYLTVDEIIRINDAELGSNSQLRDFGALESATLRPMTTVGGQDAYPTIHDKAAALLHSLARNHAFIDGNKRSAAIATVLFYRLNGWSFEAEQGELVGLIVDAAEGRLDVDDIAGLLKGSTKPPSEDDDGLDDEA